MLKYKPRALAQTGFRAFMFVQRMVIGLRRQCNSCADRLFGRELDRVASVQFGLVIACNDPQFQDMLSWLDAVQRTFSALEHAHQFAIDIGVGVVTALALSELVLNIDFVAFQYLAFGWREDFNAGAFGRLKRGSGCRRRRGFGLWMFFAMLMLCLRHFW